LAPRPTRGGKEKPLAASLEKAIVCGNEKNNRGLFEMPLLVM